MRPDGRPASKSRPVRLTPGYVEHQKGSVLAEFGKTRALCGATGKERLPHWLCQRIERCGWVTAEGEPFEQAALDATLSIVATGIHQLLRLQATGLDEWGIDHGTAK